MAASANIVRAYEADDNPAFNHLPVQASSVCYAGAAMTADSNGDVGPLNVSEAFAGFAEQKVDNGSGSAGDEDVQVRSRGKVTLSVTGVDDHDDYNAAVYATDDNTFTLTASGGLQIGKVVRWISGTTCVVSFEAAALRSI